VGNNAFYGVKAPTVTAYGPLPSGADRLPKTSSTKKYVVTARHLASWLPWLVANISTYAIIDETTQEEFRVVLGAGGVGAVEIAASLGLAPAKSGASGGRTATYAMPTVIIEGFDVASGRVEVLVTPAEGGEVTERLVTDSISVEWSDNLADWDALDGVTVDASSDLAEGNKGRFSCTCDPSAHRFYRVKVTGR
jgi:hypothetical protein